MTEVFTFIKRISELGEKIAELTVQIVELQKRVDRLEAQIGLNKSDKLSEL